MDNTSRVGNISSSTSISSSNSGNSSGGKAIDVNSSRRAHTGIASSIARTIGVSSIGTSISTIDTSIGVSTIGRVSISTIECISISLSLPLGNMDNTSRVGNISSSSSISSSKGGDSSGGKAIDVNSSRGAHTGIASSIAKTIGVSSIGTIETSSIGVSTTIEARISIGSIVGVSFSISHGTSGQNNNSQELVHVEYFCDFKDA